MLGAEDISALLFNTTEGSQLIDQLNNQLRLLVNNDLALLDDGQYSPQIWERKWINNSDIPGYKKGQSVWINTQTPMDILNSRYKQVEQYIMDNPFLSQMYNNIDKSDQAKVNELFLKAISGTAHRNVGALYYLGDLAKPAQIKISKVSNNKDLPTASTWKDFYTTSSKNENITMMMNALSAALSSRMDQHREVYHNGVSGMTRAVLDDMGFFNADPFALSNVQTQSFYDHEYCDQLRGFDCAISVVLNTTCSMRQWKSGYLEQWGYAANNKNALIQVTFKKPYNYSFGSYFYQNSFGYFGSSPTAVDGKVLASNRYIVTVTPALKAGDNVYPYPENPVTISDQKMYACVDVTKIDNDGFQIVNADTSKSRYEGYYWSVCGYTVTTQ